MRSNKFMSQTEKGRETKGAFTDRNTASGSSKNPPGRQVDEARRLTRSRCRRRQKQAPLMTSEVCFCGASGASADEKTTYEDKIRAKRTD